MSLRQRFRQLDRWNDRITDSDYHPDYNPVRYRLDPDVMKYDIFLSRGWAWYMPSDGMDCQATESFRTMADAKRALSRAVRMDPAKEPCLSCPHFRDGRCMA